MTEAVDPDPQRPADDGDRSTLGGRSTPAPGADPTRGGKDGQIGETASIAADEPADGSSYPVGGGRVREETDQTPGAGA
ncbi:hypothetical protein GB931_04665 [Modestobacter sp. I12A-02628]|uniref:Uncharacterized protein n=1 Tax=Goekera deserti TaxID=2497753 RepID=A0A7K3WH71_9ACTN|nr:hypothetical protein [Goekera deserti]MPQ97230.1 hypothetical protein [Goekera deserti]NDI50260.1 hypothetical protein [Goekera deserti]NEL55828.1 hypothetical protein [Goekera deserti]